MTKFAIPEAALDTHIGILGRTGSGKTFTARGMVERLLDAQRQVVIVDPTGAWWGLRSAFAIPIFGGEHGDVEITDHSGEAVAETILTHHSSAIVDLSGLARQSGAGMRRFMATFIARLKDRERGALWLVLDEADEFLPQVLQPDMTRLFGDLRMKAHWGKNYDTSRDAWPQNDADWRQTPHGAPWDSNVHMAKFCLALAEQIAALRARSQGGE